jgi:hypothetical protein
VTCHLPFACSKVVKGFILNLLLDKHHLSVELNFCYFPSPVFLYLDHLELNLFSFLEDC